MSHAHWLIYLPYAVNSMPMKQMRKLSRIVFEYLALRLTASKLIRQTEIS